MTWSCVYRTYMEKYFLFIYIMRVYAMWKAGCWHHLNGSPRVPQLPQPTPILQFAPATQWPAIEPYMFQSGWGLVLKLKSRTKQYNKYIYIYLYIYIGIHCLEAGLNLDASSQATLGASRMRSLRRISRSFLSGMGMANRVVPQDPANVRYRHCWANIIVGMAFVSECCSISSTMISVDNT